MELPPSTSLTFNSNHLFHLRTSTRIALIPTRCVRRQLYGCRLRASCAPGEPLLTPKMECTSPIPTSQDRLLTPLANSYMGWWGNLGSPTQKNIITYSMSANRLNPTNHILRDGVFNTFRRTRNQILYWAPPLLLAYMAMDWATERYEQLD